ncbi:MAG: hypothetical protein LQ340_007929, partial [Diploschistes diacapsis]
MILLFKLLLSVSLVQWAQLSKVAAAPQGSIWTINIDNNPAPSPEDGPAQSANAIRDPAYLPIQIGSIVGAYLVWIILVGIAILTVGRRLRRGAQSSPKSLNMEILRGSVKQVQPESLPKAFNPSPISEVKVDPWDPSPVSPTKKSNPWDPSPGSPTKKNPWSPKLGSWSTIKKHRRQDSTQSSILTFDESVISEDRARNEIEMDRLYAAVAEHDAERTQGRVESQVVPASLLSQNPSELQHLRYAPRQQGYPLSPPPENEIQRSPTSLTLSSRESTGTPRRMHKKAPAPLTFNNPPSRNSSRSSFASFRSF